MLFFEIRFIDQTWTLRLISFHCKMSQLIFVLSLFYISFLFFDSLWIDLPSLPVDAGLFLWNLESASDYLLINKVI